MRENLSRATEALFVAARLAVLRDARDREVEARQLATTLTVAVVGLLDAVVGKVGDGLIAVKLGDVVCTPMLQREKEYANESDFITQRDWRERLSIERLGARELSGIALSSDGLRLVACANTRLGTPYEPFFEDLFSGVQRGITSDHLEAFLNGVEDRTGDDKSLLVAVRG